LAAIDLFNHGYYWEAHEAWESLWLGCGRTGVTADFLKGLIKLAAAGVKARERRTEGVLRHARRAAELFASTSDHVAGQRYLGLDLGELQAHCGRIMQDPGKFVPAPRAPADVPAVEVLFDFWLHPH
jgi:predicted metal-dependent hydrolase